MSNLNGRVVVITGGSSGIGAATCQRLLAAGAKVVSADRSASGNASDVVTPSTTSPNFVTVRTDVGSFDDCQRMATFADESYGGIDALVVSAGIDDSAKMHDGDPDRWREVIETNLVGAAYSVRSCLPHLIARGGGDIILISSIAGRRPTPAQPMYSASKWGVVGLGNALRTEAAGYGVRVTLLEPGMVDTQLSRQSSRGRELLQTVAPLSPSDVAEAIHFALSQPRNVCVAEMVLMPAGQP